MLEAIPEMVAVTLGEAPIGDVWGGGDADEQPVRVCTLPPFRLARYAVTNAQYALFLNETAQERVGRAPVGDLGARSGGLEVRGGEVRCRPGREDYPVTCVTWHGACAYCEWLSTGTGEGYRLPTEHEWQHAAMGPRRLAWALGNRFEAAKYVCRAAAPQPVDWGDPTDLGFHALTGNVFEWCSDEYRFSLDQAAPLLARHRVIKGGAFILAEAANLRNAKRFSCHEESCLGSIGFRIAASGGRNR